MYDSKALLSIEIVGSSAWLCGGGFSGCGGLYMFLYKLPNMCLALDFA